MKKAEIYGFVGSIGTVIFYRTLSKNIPITSASNLLALGFYP